MQQLRNQFFACVRKEFAGGIMPHSIIDRKKFTSVFAKYFTFPLPVNYGDQQTILNLAQEVCIAVDRKFYAVDAEAEMELRKVMQAIAEQGHNAIFYKPLHRHYTDKFVKLGIGSPEILAACIKKYFTVESSQDYFSIGPESLEAEIKRKCAGRAVINEDNLMEAFPFIPPEIALQILRKNTVSQLSKNGNLLALDAIQFEKEEEEEAIAKIESDIAKYGYMSLAELDLPGAFSLYPDISEKEIREVFCKRLNKLGYEKKGNFIKPIGGEHVTKHIEKYCKTHDRFSYNDIINYFGIKVKKLRHLIWIIQKSAIQISKHEFISLNNIKFDTNNIDNDLNNIIAELPTTLLSFKSYYLLSPLIDFKWNKYFLQSFVIHYSKKFILIQPVCNNKSIGIIYNKNYHKKPNYYQLAAKIAINDNINPLYNDISEYAICKGLLASKRQSAINNIIKNMS